VSTNGRPDSGLFARRRRELLRQLKRGVVLVPTAPQRTRSNDTEYPYRPDTDFFYLTGFSEPHAVAVLRPGQAKPFVLFVQPRDPERETWDGRRYGPEGARQIFGADLAFPIGALDEELPKLLAGADRVFLAPGKYPEFDAKVNAILDGFRKKSRAGIKPPSAVLDLREVLHEMRLAKGPEDIHLHRRAAAISGAGHIAAMRAARPGMLEYEIEAVLEYVFRKLGARAPGYNHIVASGPNATILHYNENNREMADGELLLIDAGAEYGLYTGDITRTFPVNGRFTPAQRDIYGVVLAAQKAAITAIGPGVPFNRVHDTAVRAVTRGLVALGLLRGTLADLIKKEKYKRFFMHGTSHWLGMDVHDVGSYKDGKRWRRLMPGHVLTVEPGIYIPADARGVPKRYLGIGVRIEDDVLVTRTGREVLTAAVPKEIADIEATMAQPLSLPV